ncbi:hypothetical protein EIN_113620, partial [Entamoeba invadens IP1]
MYRVQDTSLSSVCARFQKSASILRSARREKAMKENRPAIETSSDSTYTAIAVKESLCESDVVNAKGLLESTEVQTVEMGIKILMTIYRATLQHKTRMTPESFFELIVDRSMDILLIKLLGVSTQLGQQAITRVLSLLNGISIRKSSLSLNLINEDLFTNTIMLAQDKRYIVDIFLLYGNIAVDTSESRNFVYQHTKALLLGIDFKTIQNDKIYDATAFLIGTFFQGTPSLPYEEVSLMANILQTLCMTQLYNVINSACIALSNFITQTPNFNNLLGELLKKVYASLKNVDDDVVINALVAISKMSNTSDHIIVELVKCGIFNVFEELIDSRKRDVVCGVLYSLSNMVMCDVCNLADVAYQSGVISEAVNYGMVSADDEIITNTAWIIINMITKINDNYLEAFINVPGLVFILSKVIVMNTDPKYDLLLYTMKAFFKMLCFGEHLLNEDKINPVALEMENNNCVTYINNLTMDELVQPETRT